MMIREADNSAGAAPLSTRQQQHAMSSNPAQRSSVATSAAGADTSGTANRSSPPPTEVASNRQPPPPPPPACSTASGAPQGIPTAGGEASRDPGAMVRLLSFLYARHDGAVVNRVGLC